MVDEEAQYRLWMDDVANHFLQAAHSLENARCYCPEDASQDWFHSRIGFLLQEADTINPDGNAWPKDQTDAKLYFFEEERIKRRG